MLMSVTSDNTFGPKSPEQIYGNQKIRSMQGPHPQKKSHKSYHKKLGQQVGRMIFESPKYVGKNHTPNDLVVCFLFGGGEDSTSSALAMAPCPVVHPLVPRSKEVPFSMRQVGDGRYQNRFSVWILQTELVAWIPELSHNHGSGKLP